MSPSNFQFLQGEWLELFASAARAEELANTDAWTSSFYARRTLESVFDLIGWRTGDR